MRIQCIARPAIDSDLHSTIGTLFSAWQATTQAWQPVHLSRSTIIVHLCSVSVSSVMKIHSSMLRLRWLERDVEHLRSRSTVLSKQRQRLVFVGLGDLDAHIGPGQVIAALVQFHVRSTHRGCCRVCGHNAPDPNGPGPSGIATVSGRMAGKTYTGASISPCGDSIFTMSPFSTPSSSAVLGLISTQVCQEIVVSGSGEPCSQGRFAPLPSPSSTDR